MPVRVEPLLTRRHKCPRSITPGNAAMYPFNTIPRPVLAYNQHDPRHAATTLGPFPSDIAPNILECLALRDAASLRNASMINLYSYFACGPARTEHGARLATARMGTTSSVHQLYFNLHSVLDLVRNNASGITEASKVRMLAGLIDEIIRCGLRPLTDLDLSLQVADSIIAATGQLPVAERTAMRWRLLDPLKCGDVAFGHKHQLDSFAKAAAKSSEDLPVEDRALFPLLRKVHYFWLQDGGGDASNMTPEEIADLISCIISLPHHRQVALLTRIADKIERSDNHGETCQVASHAILSACEDWPLPERMAILARVRPLRSYPHGPFPWNAQQRADAKEKQALLDEYRLLPADQKPATLAQLIHWFGRNLRASTSHYMHQRSALPWTLASTMVTQAAKLKSVHSSAIVMAELGEITRCFDLPNCKKSVARLRQAFSAANEDEARTRSRQLVCLDPTPKMLAILCADDSTLHSKTKLAASLLLRIAKLKWSWDHIPAEKRNAARANDAIAIWKESTILGSRRCNDIRFKLLKEMGQFRRKWLLPAFEAILQEARQLSPELKVKLCALFVDYAYDADVEMRPGSHTIVTVVDLALSLPSHEPPGTLRQVMDAANWMTDISEKRATADLMTRVVARCMALPTTDMVTALIELADSTSFYSAKVKPLVAPLFYQILEKSAGLEPEHKGPLLFALTRYLAFIEKPDQENAFEALTSEVDTLPEASRSAWRLYIRIVTADYWLDQQHDEVRNEVATALRQDCEALDEHQRGWLYTMVRTSLYWRGGRFGS